MSIEIKLNILVGIMCGVILGIPFTPIVCLLRKLLIVPFTHKRILKKSIKEGHIVKAILIKATNAKGDYNITDSSRKVGKYQYEYKNKKYKVDLVGQSPIPQELTLYFERNPRKAVVENSLGLYESPLLKCYVVSIFIMSVIITYIGVKYGFGW